jgi:hypothetical protein
MLHGVGIERSGVDVHEYYRAASSHTNADTEGMLTVR